MVLMCERHFFGILAGNSVPSLQIIHSCNAGVPFKRDLAGCM